VKISLSLFSGPESWTLNTQPSPINVPSLDPLASRVVNIFCSARDTRFEPFAAMKYLSAVSDTICLKKLPKASPSAVIKVADCHENVMKRAISFAIVILLVLILAFYCVDLLGSRPADEKPDVLLAF
jgi:hypothetical protein